MAIRAAELEVIVSADTSGAEAGLAAVSNRLDALARPARQLGTALSLGVTAPLAGLGLAALNEAANFQRAMNIIAAVTGATDDELRRISETAKALGADMSLPATSATDAVRAMTELSKAGLSVDQALAAAKGTLQLAAAAGINEAEAAKVTAGALNAFGLAGEDATRVANLLAAAANASAADMIDLTLGFQQASFSFAATQQSIESLTTALALLSNAGLQGSDAGTALKNAFIRMMSPTKQAKELMDKLGISFYDAQGNMLPLRDIIGILNERLSGLTMEQRNAALETIFLSDGMKAMIPLLNASTQGFDAMLAAVTREGAAADLAASRMQGFKGALEGLKSQLETAGLVLAERFLPVFEGITRAIADLVGAFAALPVPVQNAVIAMAALAAAVGPVLVAIAAFSALLGPAAALTAALGVPLLGLVAIFAAVAVAVGALVAAWSANFLGIRDITAAVVSTIGDVLSTAVDIVATIARGIVDAISFAWDTIRSVTEATWSTIVTVIQTLWGLVPDSLKQDLDHIAAEVQQTFEAVRGYIEASLNAIRSVINTVWGAIGDETVAALGVISKAVKVAWDAIRDVTDVIWPAVRDSIVQVWDENKQTIKGALEVIQGILKIGWETIKGITLIFLNVLQGDWEGAWQAMLDMIHGIWDGVKLVIAGGIDILLGILGDLPGQVLGALASLPDVMLSLGRELVNGLIRGIWSMAGAVGGAIEGVVNGAIARAKTALGISSPSRVTREEVGRPMAEGVIAGLRDMFTMTLPTPTLAPAFVPVPTRKVGPIIINVQGTVIAERDLARTIREELLRLGRKNLSVGLA